MYVRVSLIVIGYCFLLTAENGENKWDAGA